MYFFLKFADIKKHIYEFDELSFSRLKSCLFMQTSDGDPDQLLKQILIYASRGLDSMIIFLKHILSVL